MLLYFGSMCFCQLIGIPMIKPHLWKTYILLLWKEVVLQIKKQDLQKSAVFSNILRLIDDLCIFSIMILMSWTSGRKIKVLVKPRFGTFPLKYLIEHLLLSCLITDMPFLFTSTTNTIWIAIYHLKYFMLQSVLKFMYNKKPD